MSNLKMSYYIQKLDYDMPKVGYKFNKEAREKMRQSHLGKKQSQETKDKRNAKLKGRIFSDEWRLKISKAKTGVKYSKEAVEKNRLAHLGKKASLETRIKLSLRQKGSLSHFWKGGIHPKHLIQRKSFEYRLWREAVFKRDNYTCIWCGDNKGGNLEADHIKPFAFYPELRFAIDNGRTLCHNCHQKTDTYGNRSYKQLRG